MRKWSVTVCVLLCVSAIRCGEDEPDPASLVQNLRVLGISAQPVDLVAGETMLLETLVVSPDDDEVSYHWEWCPFTAGADELFSCESEQLGPDEAAFFDLGDGETASLDSFNVILVLTGICEALQGQIEDLEEYADLLAAIGVPDCEVGIDVTIRLTVSTADSERVAIKRVFVWLSEPDDLQRNRNPVIVGIVAGDEQLPEGTALEAEADEAIDWYVDVPADSLEPFLLRSDPDGEERRESITYSFFTTAGEWDEEGGFADDNYVTRQEGGEALLTLPADLSSSEVITTWFVIRDERGGVAWTSRQVRIGD